MNCDGFIFPGLFFGGRFMMMLIIVAIIVLIVLEVRKGKAGHSENSSLKILEEQFALGKITSEEFEEKRRVLKSY